MKTITETIYVTTDGTKFVDQAEAEAHEASYLKEHPELVLAGKSAEELLAAMDGNPRDVADALETIGRMTADRRKARGEFRRGAGERPTTAQLTAADTIVEDGIVTKSKDGPVGVPAEHTVAALAERPEAAE